MRKYLAGGVAIAVAAALGGTAVAQDNPVSMSTTLKPTKAGTKKKPKNTTISTTVSSTANDKVTTQIDIQMPKTFKVSGKGFKRCGVDTVINSPEKCPKGSKVGKGTAEAIAGINKAEKLNVTFDVVAYVAGANKLNFRLAARGLSNVYNAPGVIKKTSKGPLLKVTVPLEAQQPAKMLWATLTQLKTTLGGKSGAKYLIATTGCKNKKQPLSVKLHFGTPPTDGSDTTVPAGSGSADGSAKCKK